MFLAFFALCEYSLAVWIGNPFALSFFGMYIAVLVSQFGHLGLVLIQVVEIAMVLGGIFVLQNGVFFGKKRLGKY